MATVTVSTAEELAAAYAEMSVNGGGTILVSASAEPFPLVLNGGGTDLVTIRSEDPDDPAQITRLTLSDVENVAVSDLYVFSDGAALDPTRKSWHDDLNIFNSKSIEISDIVFEGDAKGFMDPSDPDAVWGITLGDIKDSTDVTFTGNTASNYWMGLGVFNSYDTIVSGNEFTALQADGIRMMGVDGIEISGNYLHDFLGSLNRYNHDDMIQLFSTGADFVSRDITITGNILDASGGAGSQTMFIGNERDKDDPDHVYENITISDNVIYNGAINGIFVAGADGVQIENNTLLWNPDAGTQAESDSSIKSSPPEIRLNRIENGEVTGNIAYKVPSSTESTQVYGNQTVSYENPFAENYVGANFVNAVEGGSTDLRDLRLLPDSDWAGLGSTLSQSATQSSDGGVEAVMTAAVSPTDIGVWVFDASLSLDADGFADASEYTFAWTFSDGTTAEGAQVSHDFDGYGDFNVSMAVVKDGEILDTITRSVTVDPETLLQFDFETGVKDLSPYDSRLDDQDAANLTEGADGQGYQIGGDRKINIERYNDQIHNLETFGISLDLAAGSEAAAGVFLYFHKVFEARIMDDGRVSFELKTSEDTYEIVSDRVIFDDTDFRTIEFGFDGVNGALVMRADGEIVAQTEAFGVTAPKTYYGIAIGNTFNGSVDATVDNFVMSSDANLDDAVLPDIEDPEIPPVLEEPDVPVVPDAPAPAPPPKQDDEPETPPAQENPGDDNDGGSGLAQIFSFLLDLIAALFGGGGSDKNKAEVTEVSAEAKVAEFSLFDLVPDTGLLEEQDHGVSAEEDAEEEEDSYSIAV